MKWADDEGWAPAPERWGRADLLALAAWTAAVALFFWKALTCQGAFFYFDITEINLPYRDFFARELQQGRFSRWIPGLFCGHPLYSESQAGYLHPFKYLFYPWMEPWKAFGYDCVLSVWLTGAAAYGWLRRHVGPAGALTGGAVFALSGYTWAHFIHTSMLNALPSVPLMVWAVELAWVGGRLWPLVMGAVALACQVFAGHLQDALVTGLGIGVLSVWRAVTARGGKERVWAVGSVVGMGALGVALAGVQWVPSKELIDRSPRTEMTWEDLTYGSWAPELLPTVAMREAYGTRARNTDWMDGYYPYHEMNVYMGIVTVALAALGLGAGRARWVSGFVVLGAVGLLMMLGRFTFLMDRMHQVPFLGRGRVPVRYHLWVVVAASALSAVGVDRLAKVGRVRLKAAYAAVGGLLTLSVPIMIMLYLPIWTGQGQWGRAVDLERFRWLGEDLAWGLGRMVLLLSAAAVLARLAAGTADARRRWWLAMGLPVLVVVDLMAAHWHEAPTIDPSYWTKAPPSARWIKEQGDVIRIYGENTLHSAEPGYASKPVNFEAVKELLAWSLPPVWGLDGVVGVTPIYSVRRFLFQSLPGLAGPDIEGMNYLVTGRKGVRLRGDEGTSVGTVRVFHNPEARPRARFLGRPVYADSRSGAEEAMKRGGLAVRDRAVVEDPDRPLKPGAEARGKARITKDQAERVEVEVRAETAGYLVLADTYDPGWSVSVDGQPGTVRPAFVAFRAVYLGPGTHQVVFTYEPAGWKAGLILTAVGGLVGLVMIFWPGTMPKVGDGHGQGVLPGWWGWALVGVMALVVAVSAVKVDEKGFGVQDRWKGSWHPFTWGAGLEAIKPPPPMPEFDRGSALLPRRGAPDVRLGVTDAGATGIFPTHAKSGP